MNAKKPVSALLALALSLSLTLPALAAKTPAFTDVPEGAWYASAVDYAVSEGLMAGTTDTTFSPAAFLTRAQLLTILYRRAGTPTAPAALPFTDVAASAWCAPEVRWAASEGLLDGFGPALQPNRAISRAETAILLHRFAIALGCDVSVGEDTNILSYDDVFSLPEGGYGAMQWALGADVIRGTSERTISPNGSLTRAQAAVMLQRLDAALDKWAPLSYWNDDARAKTTLTRYVEAVTDPASVDFIPVEDRIAVFDLDGTLFCETDPNYFDYMLLAYRVLEDPSYKDKASAFEREVAEKIAEQNRTGASFSGLEVDHGKAVASAFKGMTVAEFNAYIQDFKDQPMPSYSGMTRGEGFYLPMVQVVDYLQDHDFTVYIISGTDRLIVRGIIDNSPLNVPNRQIIGSDETIVASGQNGADGLSYVFTEGDELILGGDFIIKNLKMNKVSVIMQEIGQQPVLSFGNSTGDSSMAEYVTSGNAYRSLAFMLCCDDTERENGNQAKAGKMYDLCEEFDWVPVSMKNDWTTIYGPGVVYQPAA